MQPPRERRPDPELTAARYKRVLSYFLFGIGAFTVVADVASTTYEAPPWVGPLFLALAGGLYAKGARDAVQSLGRRADRREDQDDA